MQNYQGFENWLKGNQYVSWKTYLSFMKQIENTLMVKDFDKIRSVTVLEQLFKQLESNRAFTARSKSDKDNILSGFRAYIKYIKWIKENK
ncbi:MAG: hypothetical protein EOO06_13195 [Chitinophagaceae bacterium]|nr:MAG: hypothetical protein EOO06_13195 [Chitinophagaceae bacterium]